MSKRVLILSTSLRKNRNSETLADAFLAGALEAGHTAEKVCLHGKDIRFCRGCGACQKAGKCVIGDDVAGILEKMRQADVIAFATPIYYYEMSGQMKTLLDRTYPLYPLDCAFREIYLLAASADASERAMDGAVKGLEGWIACFEKARLAGVIRGVDADGPDGIQGHPAVLEEARRMGGSI